MSEPDVRTFTSADDLAGARFTGVDLRGARVQESDLSGAVLRGVELSGIDVDAPWIEEGDGFVVNGVDVTSYVVGELDRRFPGRSRRRASDPDGLRAAWTAVEQAWAAAVARAEALPAGSVDEQVDGEWSFAETLRHLVMATDLWLGRAVLGREEPFHPLGLDCTADGVSLHVAPVDGTPPWSEVLAARADRQSLVRDLLAPLTDDDLAVTRTNPHAPDHPETTLSCVHVVLEEEWEHLRFATRDLDALAARGAP